MFFAGQRSRTLKVTLPDGSEINLESGATAYDVAASIGAGLAKAAIGAIHIVGGERKLADLHAPLPGDCGIELLTATDDNPESLNLMRHSAAHVMAEAITAVFPDTKLAYGPALEDGFYYDLATSHSITPDDFAKIEAEMTRIVKEDRPFKRIEMSRSEAMEKLEKEGNRFKIDNAEAAKGDSLSFYITGDEGKFEDLCLGPHIPSTGFIKAFKIRQVSGSYYRGDVNEEQLQRVYGTAFFKKKNLTEYLERLEEAKKRDHRVLAKELNLFSISPDVGSGLVLWHPNGSLVRQLLENFVKSELIIRGYTPVYAPAIGRLDLYRTSGHYPYYQESQFPALFETDRGRSLFCLQNMIKRALEEAEAHREEPESKARVYAKALVDVFGAVEGMDPDGSLESMSEAVEANLREEEGYLLKPMNCPHHIHIYKAVPRSYRDLPVRLAEFGTVYRWEQSGELTGMTRVRGFTQDDAHIFCTPDQLFDELRSTVELTQLVLSTLEFTDYRVRIGLRDPDSAKYTGNSDLWDRAEQNLREVVHEMGIEAKEEAGEAAFYGPKIDFLVKDCIGRQWQLGTVQVDYNLPERFDISYVGSDNKPHRPVMVHRAPLGSLERFVSILIEHYAGAFPLWLSPVQVAVATVSDKSRQYGRKVYESLQEAGLRVELDTSSDKIGPKKHRLRAMKIPYILVVGETEAVDGTVNVNDRDGATLGSFPLANFIEWCLVEIQTKGKKRDKALGG